MGGEVLRYKTSILEKLYPIFEGSVQMICCNRAKRLRLVRMWVTVCKYKSPRLYFSLYASNKILRGS